MKTDKKKIAAAIAAVYAHLSTTEQVYYAPPAAEALPGMIMQSQAPAVSPNVWGMSGRQTQMQANTMMQLRVFK
jgi:hypothetical protein